MPQKKEKNKKKEKKTKPEKKIKKEPSPQIEESKFTELLEPQSISAPTLEKIAIQQPLETNITTSASDVPEIKPTDYSNSSNAPKYNDAPKDSDQDQKYEENFSSPTLQTRTQSQVLMEQPQDTRINTNNTETNILEPKIRDTLETDEKKYQETRL